VKRWGPAHGGPSVPGRSTLTDPGQSGSEAALNCSLYTLSRAVRRTADTAAGGGAEGAEGWPAFVATWPAPYTPRVDAACRSHFLFGSALQPRY